jgi:L-alanine-DL-glutamate epimerase-like enolase superfamily enzyme
MITRIETYATGTVCLVRVVADDGSEGWGQTAPYHADISALVLHRQVAPHVLGGDETELEALGARVLSREMKYPGSYVCRALGGVDLALWDLRGKRAGKSVCALLGGTLRALPVYGSSMRRDITPEQEAERLLRLQETEGYRAFKIRVGDKYSLDSDAWPGRTEAIIPTVRKALGDETVLLADANSAYTPKRAITVGRLLEEHGYGHFEEPCPYPELEWTKQVADALTIPVSGGEQDTDLPQFRRMLTMGAVDIVQPDVCYVGGLTRTLAVARMAAELGIPCTPHAANRSLLQVATAHLLCAIPNGGPLMECSIEPTPWTEALFAPTLTVHDGCMTVPDAPGWGVTIRPEWLERAEHQISERT